MRWTDVRFVYSVLRGMWTRAVRRESYVSHSINTEYKSKVHVCEHPCIWTMYRHATRCSNWFFITWEHMKLHVITLEALWEGKRLRNEWANMCHVQRIREEHHDRCASSSFLSHSPSEIRKRRRRNAEHEKKLVKSYFKRVRRWRRRGCYVSFTGWSQHYWIYVTLHFSAVYLRPRSLVAQQVVPYSEPHSASLWIWKLKGNTVKCFVQLSFCSWLRCFVVFFPSVAWWNIHFPIVSILETTWLNVRSAVYYESLLNIMITLSLAYCISIETTFKDFESWSSVKLSFDDSAEVNIYVVMWFNFK